MKKPKHLKLTNKEKYILHAYLSMVGGIDLNRALFDKQRDFVFDKSKYRAALVGRAGGKSHSVAALMLHTALMTGLPIAYSALTRVSAKRIMWNMLKKMADEYNIQCNFKLSDLTVYFPNGAEIILLGLDNSASEQHKLRGQQYRMVVIDEAGHFSQNLKDMIEEVIISTLKAHDGELILIGTPGNLLTFKNMNDNSENLGIHHKRNDYFYKVTEGMEAGWSVHKWSNLDNPHVAEQEKKMRAKLLADNPLIEKTSFWKREVLGDWYQDDGSQVIKYSDELNKFYELDPKHSYIYSGGIDFGWQSQTAIVVCAYDLNDGKFYVVDWFKKSGMSVDDIGMKLTSYAEKYPVTSWFADHMPMVTNELTKRYSLNIQPSDKQNKYQFIQFLNNDFIMGNIKIHEKVGNKELIEELETIIWDEENPTLVYAGCSDHIFDALRYCWRHSYHYIKNKKIVEDVNEHEKWTDDFFKQKMQKARDIEANLGKLNEAYKQLSGGFPSFRQAKRY